MYLQNPIRVFPARLIHPKVQADCRWIAVNANNRRAFTLKGKDEVPQLLSQFSTGIAQNQSNEILISKLGITNFWGKIEAECSYLDWYRALISRLLIC
jgi:hypothetical protein